MKSKIALAAVTLFSVFLTPALSQAADKTVTCTGAVVGTYTVVDRKPSFGFDFWEFSSEKLNLSFRIESDMSNYTGPDLVESSDQFPKVKFFDVQLKNVGGVSYLGASAKANAVDAKLEVEISFRSQKDDTTNYVTCTEK